ncbi:MAG: hypothetical protein AB8B51_10935 [Sedimentitalea sp.]
MANPVAKVMRRLAAWALVLVLMGSHALKSEDTAMASSDTHFPGLQNMDLFSMEQSQLDQIEVTLSENDFQGMVLYAPSQLNLAGGTLPLLLLWQQTGLRAWDITDVTNMSLLLTDLDTGHTQAVAPLEDPKDLDIGGLEPTERPPKPTGASATSTVTRSKLFDARPLFDLSAVGPRLSLVAISWDWSTRPVAVRLSDKTAADQDLKVTPPEGHATLPRYGLGSAHQEFSVHIEMTPKNGPVANGNFTVPFHPDLFAAKPGALVPATFALFKRDVPVPWLMHWILPAHGTPEPGSLLTGSFSVELNPFVSGGIPAGDYVGYLMLDQQISNPAFLRLRQ